MNRNLRPGDEYYSFRYMLRRACPLEGSDWYKFMSVSLEPGARISQHKHAYATVLYYPELAEPVTVTPQPGTMLYLPKDTLHEVPVVKRKRLSIAMLIEEK